MALLVGLLSTGKGTWGHVSRLVSDERFGKIILFTNAFGKERYTPGPNVELIELDFAAPIETLRDQMREHLTEPVKAEMEVDVTIISGSGKEHIALLSALLRLGVGIRLVIHTDEGVVDA